MDPSHVHQGGDAWQRPAWRANSPQHRPGPRRTTRNTAPVLRLHQLTCGVGRGLAHWLAATEGWQVTASICARRETLTRQYPNCSNCRFLSNVLPVSFSLLCTCACVHDVCKNAARGGADVLWAHPCRKCDGPSTSITYVHSSPPMTPPPPPITPLSATGGKPR